jgi:hypothetical protein
MIRIFTALSGAQVSWIEREAFLGANFVLIEEMGIEIGSGLGVLAGQAWWIW